MKKINSKQNQTNTSRDDGPGSHFNIRLGLALRKEVDRVAALGDMKPADVIRRCVKYGLPLVEEGYIHLQSLFERELEKIKSKSNSKE